MSEKSKVFSLVGQGLKLDTKADIQPHLDKLEEISDLEEIHLGGNTLGVEACQALADVLTKKKTLKVADFADIFTGRLISEIPDALRALCDALTDHTGLVELNLSDNAFGGRSAEPMVNFLKNNHSFSILKLNNNGLGVTGGTIVAEALFEAAQNLKAKGLESNLRTVICGRNRLENGSAPLWAKAYAAHGGLVEVRMFQNGIRMEGIEAISRGLASCPNLEVLDLQDNTATLRGSRAIATCLPKWPKLKTLNLSDCLLKPKGGALVFGALAKGSNPALETIQVQYCDLDRKVLDQLGSAIELHLTSLTQLDINGNWADEDDECIEKIRSALAKHGHEDALLELDELDPEGEESEEEEEEDEEGAEEEERETKPAGTEAKVDETDELASALAKTSVADEQGTIDATKAEASKSQTSEASAVPVANRTAATGESPATPVAIGTGVPQMREKDTEPTVQSSEEAVNKPAYEAANEPVNAGDIEPSSEITNVRERAEEPAHGIALGQAQEQPAVAVVLQKNDASTAQSERPNAGVVAGVSSADPTATDAQTSQIEPAMDLSGELYSKSAVTDASASPTPAAAPGVHPDSAKNSPAKKKRGFRAAWGAIRELLR